MSVREMSIGNRIYTNIERPEKSLIEAFTNVPSSNIGDMMNRLYCMREQIIRIGNWESQLLGTAITVKVPDGDNAFIHMAIDMAQPGDVLVVDGNGCTSRSLMGEIMFTYAQNKGITGIIVDGAIRDNDALNRLNIPVYAMAVTPQGPYKNGPGEINVPVSCGGQVVFPGDILVGAGGGSGYLSNDLINKSMYCYDCLETDDEFTKTISVSTYSSIPMANAAKQENGYARVTYLGNEVDSSSNYHVGDVWDFDYKEENGNGVEQIFTVPVNGIYKLEVWGAQGGTAKTFYTTSGTGGYSVGNISW